VSVWFTSDLHIGHGSVAKHRAEAAVICAPWGDDDAIGPFCVAWHDRTLAFWWDAVVRPNDVVWVLGDLCVGGAEATAYALNWIYDRPGVKHLIAGNHDPVHPMHRDSHRWQHAFLQAFASIQPFARRRIEGKEVLLSHFPYGGDHTAEERCNQYRLRDERIPLLHGHTHSQSRVTHSEDVFGSGLKWSKQVHVGVDAWDLRPVSLDQVGELL